MSPLGLSGVMVGRMAPRMCWLGMRWVFLTKWVRCVREKLYSLRSACLTELSPNRSTLTPIIKLAFKLQRAQYHTVKKIKISIVPRSDIFIIRKPHFVNKLVSILDEFSNLTFRFTLVFAFFAFRNTSPAASTTLLLYTLLYRNIMLVYEISKPSKLLIVVK